MDMTLALLVLTSVFVRADDKGPVGRYQLLYAVTETTTPTSSFETNEFGKSIPLRAKSGSMLLLSILNTETRNSSCLSRHRSPNGELSSEREAKPTEWCAGRLLGPVGLKYRTGKTLNMNRLLDLGTRGTNSFPLIHG
jgi:hypothetical protein